MKKPKNLASITLEEKNALIHTRVMGRQREEPCGGEVVDVHEEWFCCVCGTRGEIGEKRVHFRAIPNYFQDVNAALRIFDNMGPLVGIHVEVWRGAQGLVRCIMHNYPQFYSNVIAFSAEGYADALCKTALTALHIISDDEDIIEE